VPEIAVKLMEEKREELISALAEVKLRFTRQRRYTRDYGCGRWMKK
jgi:hypothetical protein